MPHDPKLGENFRVRVRFADTAGVALAVSGVTINARRQDGTTVAGTVIPDADYPVGGFIAIFLADVAGHWLVKTESAAPVVIKDEKSVTVSRLRYDAA